MDSNIKNIFFQATELDEYQRKQLISLLSASLLTDISKKDVIKFMQILEEEAWRYTMLECVKNA